MLDETAALFSRETELRQRQTQVKKDEDEAITAKEEKNEYTREWVIFNCPKKSLIVHRYMWQLHSWHIGILGIHLELLGLLLLLECQKSQGPDEEVENFSVVGTVCFIFCVLNYCLVKRTKRIIFIVFFL